MEEQMEKLFAIAQAKPYKIIISKPAGGEIPYRRIVIERKESYYQAAAYTEKTGISREHTAREAGGISGENGRGAVSAGQCLG